MKINNITFKGQTTEKTTTKRELKTAFKELGHSVPDSELDKLIQPKTTPDEYLSPEEIKLAMLRHDPTSFIY